MRLTLCVSLVTLIALCTGGCPGLDIEIPEGSREAIDFEILFNITHETESLLEPQEVVVTSYRQNTVSNEIDTHTTIETRYTTQEDTFAQVMVLRGYNVGDNERIVFNVISTGATSQGTRTVTYQKGQALFGKITDTFPIICADITQANP